MDEEEAKTYSSTLRQLQGAMPYGCMVAAPGDILFTDTLHMLHRCSSAQGMSGCGIRVLDEPHALAGIHLAAIRAPLLQAACSLSRVQMCTDRHVMWQMAITHAIILEQLAPAVNSSRKSWGSRRMA